MRSACAFLRNVARVLPDDASNTTSPEPAAGLAPRSPCQARLINPDWTSTFFEELLSKFPSDLATLISAGVPSGAGPNINERVIKPRKTPLRQGRRQRTSSSKS
eukprot:PhM_4_TR13367/c3_g1_i2/m.64918